MALLQESKLPLLPLVVSDVPAALLRLLSQEGISFVPDTLDGEAGKFVLYDSSSARRPTVTLDQVPIDVRSLQGDEVEDPFNSLEDERSKRHHWRIGGLDVCQEVARVDKRAIRQRVMARLRARIEAENGVWLRVAPVPYPYRSAFNFRINYDDYSQSDFDATLSAVEQYDDAFSHYVCGATLAEHPEALARLRGRDVGSHGYWHHTYVDATDNLRNVRRGIEVLQAVGIEPSGFASPFGRFNRGLHSALAILGITHSSEYGLAFDELPFYMDEILQIPVHPISLGMFLSAARHGLSGQRAPEIVAADIACAHFQRVANAKYQAGEPVFLYGHPTGRLGRHPHVLRAVLQTVCGFAAMWKTSLTDFALWWRARGGIRLRVHCENEQIVCHIEGQPADYRVGIEFWRGDHVAPMPADGEVVRFSPEALAFQSRRPQSLPQPVRVDPPTGLRGSLLRYFDWEEITPVDQINAAWWRGWVKRTLRKLQR